MFAIALEQYRRALEERSVLDFSDVLERAVDLLRRMDEFSQSRYRLESRYHHVLVDEFQDTSRAQWALVSLLVQAWGEGLGLATNPSIFIVGDRKQSIYRFRDAEVAVLQEAAQYIEGLRPGSRSRRSISRSFRARPELLHFVNDVFSEISQPNLTASEFTYEDRDRFPIDPIAPGDVVQAEPALGVAVAETPDACAAAVADEIGRLLREETVRDKRSGVARPMTPGDVGILFRSRTSHREFERELGVRGIPTYVYKGLGFFDADEIKDVTALLRYLAEPTSHLRTAAFLRSRFIRLSDHALATLSPDLSSALIGDLAPSVRAALDGEDRQVLDHARVSLRQWLMLVDRIPPAELLEQILSDTAYAFELGGARQRQAWENLKKMRGLVRRIQNRGYATLTRIADHLMALTAGDESNAVIEALDAVNLMTVHAAKGLEFPVVFVVNLAKGASGPPRPVRVVVDRATDAEDEPSVTVGPFISDTDEAERERERNETRRLLYVALTRARDRLYLATTLKDGAFVPGRGSLAEVLPDSLKAFLGRAPAVFNELETLGWTGLSGREYLIRLCRPVSSAAAFLQAAAGDRPRPKLGPPSDDFAAPPGPAACIRLSASELAGDDGPHDEDDAPRRSDRLFGILIHRLFELAQHLEVEPDTAVATAMARRLLRVNETAALLDPEAFVTRCAEAWLGARARPDVIEALTGEARLYEVPFTLALPDAGGAALVRGTIDCLVRQSGGRLTVVEFKTGRPRQSHRRQLDVYVRAARALFPGNVAGKSNGKDSAAPDDLVSGVLVYL
jgi:ATP-dependent exoDNAse (exonuclease V) beta subunit